MFSFGGRHGLLDRDRCHILNNEGSSRSFILFRLGGEKEILL